MPLTEVDLTKIKLPTHPRVLSGIMQLSDESALNFTELDKLIRVDQGISTSILKMANSSFYARANKITSLPQAISLLGFKMIRSMIVLLTSKSLFETGKYEKFRTYVYKHSLVTAILAKSLAEKMAMPSLEEEAFVAGLLHDIGKVIMNLQDRALFIASMNNALENQISFAESESHLFGYNHTDIGKRVAEIWKLPQIFVQIVSEHENASDIDGDQTTKVLFNIVACANIIAKKLGFGLYLPADASQLEETIRSLGLDRETKRHFAELTRANMEADPFYRFCAGMIA